MPTAPRGASAVVGPRSNEDDHPEDPIMGRHSTTKEIRIAAADDWSIWIPVYESLLFNPGTLPQSWRHSRVGEGCQHKHGSESKLTSTVTGLFCQSLFAEMA